MQNEQEIKWFAELAVLTHGLKSELRRLSDIECLIAITMIHQCLEEETKHRIEVLKRKHDTTK